MNRNVLTAVLGVFLAGSFGGNAYLYMQHQKLSKSSKERDSAVALRDSLQRVLLNMRDSLEQMISTREENQRLAAKIQELEGSTATLAAKEASYLSKIKQLQRAIGNMSPEQIEKFKTELAAKADEIKKLQDMLLRAQLDKEQAVRQAENDRASMESENRAMKDKISKGQSLQFGPVLTFGIRNKNGQQEETFKSKSIDRLKITFDIIQNPLIEQPVEQEVKIRIVGPEGEILTKDNKSLADKSTLYSLKETIVFDGEQQKVKLYFTAAAFKKGKYSVELWTDDTMKQKNTFTLE